MKGHALVSMGSVMPSVTFTIKLGSDTIDLMRKIKLAVDPNRILNPDKIFKIDPTDPGEY